MCGMKVTMALVLLLAPAACTVAASKYTESHPSAFVGQWVLQREDGTWGDTTTWLSDGTMRGSTSHPVPSDARWSERAQAGGMRVLCVSGGGEANCQPYALAGDTLVWGNGPQADRSRRIASGSGG